MTLRLCLLPLAPLLVLGIVAGQDNQPLNALEKDFQQSMSGVVLSGRFSRSASANLSEDKYTIEKATKLKDDQWQLDTRIQYGGKDLRVPVQIHVKWAGDTPVLSLTDESVAGMGKFTVRMVIYRGEYAGTWSAGPGHGGQMFGTIAKAAQP